MTLAHDRLYVTDAHGLNILSLADPAYPTLAPPYCKATYGHGPDAPSSPPNSFDTARQLYLYRLIWGRSGYLPPLSLPS